MKNVQANIFIKADLLVDFLSSIGESFYYVKYGLSIITLNVRQRISVMKTKTLRPEK